MLPVRVPSQQACPRPLSILSYSGGGCKCTPCKALLFFLIALGVTAGVLYQQGKDKTDKRRGSNFRAPAASVSSPAACPAHYPFPQHTHTPRLQKYGKNGPTTAALARATARRCCTRGRRPFLWLTCPPSRVTLPSARCSRRPSLSHAQCYRLALLGRPHLPSVSRRPFSPTAAQLPLQ